MVSISNGTGFSLMEKSISLNTSLGELYESRWRQEYDFHTNKNQNGDKTYI